LIERIDIKTKKKDTKKYIRPGSVKEDSRDLSSNKFNNPKIKIKKINLNILI
tara:strand:+ start:328 stop:483 length:156 start_codon:yes stop_codon:yes gene_type:complete